jgi:hypothetical protein
VVVLGSAARTAIDGVVVLGTEKGEVRGSDLELGSVAVEADARPGVLRMLRVLRVVRVVVRRRQALGRVGVMLFSECGQQRCLRKQLKK